MHYRIYSLNPGTGSIVRAADLLAQDDAEAVRHGHAQHPAQPFEIWCAARRVHVSTAPGDRADRTV